MKPYPEILAVIKEVRGRKLESMGEGAVHGGAFSFHLKGITLGVIWSNDLGWDHASVSCKHRTPKYQEMKYVKRMLFMPEEWVMELHPPDGDYVSIHPNVLHLWRPHAEAIPKPPRIMV